MSASDTLIAPHDTVAPTASAPSVETAHDWRPVSATAHVAQGQPVDSFLSVLPEDANGTVRGARRSTWRR